MPESTPFSTIQAEYLETITTCSVCEGNQFSLFLICEDQLVSHEKFTIQQCDSCGFRFTNPIPKQTVMGSYYESDQYVSHNDASGGLINTAYRAVRSYTLRSKLRLINKLSKGKGRILDVGCGTGAFLETCQKSGWVVVGVEPDTNARTISTNKLQIGISSDLDQLTGAEPFDVITLWHVLEHIPNLDKAIQQLYALMADGGTLLIAVPNSDSYDAKYFAENWAAYDVPRHLYHFKPSTIELLFTKHNFKLIEQRPMLFDALYIAMLSTRYQTGKTDYLDSIRVGLVSNAKAWQTGNSSSITYLLRKA